jgi:threonine dehydrogenase-like Zn-dependent dehydrogenase
MKGIYGDTPKDLTFGREMCGRVERLGAGVATDSMGQPLHEGDRVTFCYFFPCGRCPVCLQDEMGACPRKARANRVAGTAPYFNNAYGETTTCGRTTSSSRSPTRSATTWPRPSTARCPRCSTV